MTEPGVAFLGCPLSGTALGTSWDVRSGGLNKQNRRPAVSPDTEASQPTLSGGQQSPVPHLPPTKARDEDPPCGVLQGPNPQQVPIPCCALWGPVGRLWAGEAAEARTLQAPGGAVRSGKPPAPARLGHPGRPL